MSDFAPAELSARPLTAPLGLLGGTFDPIHWGHLRPALEVKAALGLAEVCLLPNYRPPHKTATAVSAAQRLAMAQLAAREVAGFGVDGRELLRDAPSYSVDTLTALRAEHPDTPLCFIMGMDSLRSLPRWHRWLRLLELAHLVVCVRPDEVATALCPAVTALLARHQVAHPAALHTQRAGAIWLAPTTPVALSSTWLRARLAQGELMSAAVRQALPASVHAYIAAYGLYTPSARLAGA
ncbi:MAG: nicotinate-nucleotide adenylyltransferase [Aeromonas sp.]